MELIRNEHFGKSGVFTARPGRSAALGARLLALVELIRIELGACATTSTGRTRSRSCSWSMRTGPPQRISTRTCGHPTSSPSWPTCPTFAQTASDPHRIPADIQLRPKLIQRNYDEEQRPARLACERMLDRLRPPHRRPVSRRRPYSLFIGTALHGGFQSEFDLGWRS